MATIVKEFRVDNSADAVWDALRDFGAVHTRLAPGFVVACELVDGARDLTFGNGMQAREVLVGLDDARRRIAYSARSERLAHHNASAQVFPDCDGCRFVWTADVLPDAATEVIGPMMEAGAKVMAGTLSK